MDLGFTPTRAGVKWCSAAVIVSLVAGIVASRAVDLQVATDEGLEEGCACCYDTDVELETAQVLRVSRREL